MNRPPNGGARSRPRVIRVSTLESIIRVFSSESFYPSLPIRVGQTSPGSGFHEGYRSECAVCDSTISVRPSLPVRVCACLNIRVGLHESWLWVNVQGQLFRVGSSETVGRHSGPRVCARTRMPCGDGTPGAGGARAREKQSIVVCHCLSIWLHALYQ